MQNNFTDLDVVNGRGQGIQRLPGNVMFRKLVSAHKRTYALAPKTHKVTVSKGIVTALRQVGTKFLEFDLKTGCYRDIGDEKAVYKTGQALREGQTRIKQELAAEAEKGVPRRSSFNASGNISLEESYKNHSIQIMESLRMEDLEASPIIDVPTRQTQSASTILQSPKPATKQSPKCTSQVEMYRELNTSESSMSRLPSLALSDTSILNDRVSSESETSLINESRESVQLLDTTEEEVDDVLKEMAFEFDFSEGLDVRDSFNKSFMTV
jgi:hypothetical protein